MAGLLTSPRAARTALGGACIAIALLLALAGPAQAQDSDQEVDCEDIPYNERVIVTYNERLIPTCVLEGGSQDPLPAATPTPTPTASDGDDDDEPPVDRGDRGSRVGQEDDPFFSDDAADGDDDDDDDDGSDQSDSGDDGADDDDDDDDDDGAAGDSAGSSDAEDADAVNAADQSSDTFVFDTTPDPAFDPVPFVAATVAMAGLGGAFLIAARRNYGSSAVTEDDGDAA